MNRDFVTSMNSPAASHHLHPNTPAGGAPRIRAAPGPKRSAALQGLRNGAGAIALLLATEATACPLALVLALDVSASVDAQEFRLQREGTAAALLAPAVRAALLSDPPVALAVTLWAGRGEQVVALGWTMLQDTGSLDAAAARIAALPRPVGWSGRTGTANALGHAAALLGAAPRCGRQVIDLSTDDIANDGASPRRLNLGQIEVNALAVGGDLPLDHGTRADEGGALTRWLEAEVIRGPGAFVEAADDWRDFAAAMERKLLREVQGMAVAVQGAGALPHP